MRIIIDVPESLAGKEALETMYESIVRDHEDQSDDGSGGPENCPICKMVRQAELVPDSVVPIHITPHNAYELLLATMEAEGVDRTFTPLWDCLSSKFYQDGTAWDYLNSIAYYILTGTTEGR